MDLKRPAWIYLKAALFLGIAGISLLLICLRSGGDLQVIILTLLACWATSRFYYFCFYVIGHYIDPAFRFSGLGSVVRHLLGRQRR